MGALVEFSNVVKRYGEGPLVLDRISLRAGQGEFVSIIGPSGCGKTTLLRLIAGLTPVSSGTLSIECDARTNASSRIAYVFQDPTLLPWLTVRKNVEMPLRLEGMPVDQRRATVERSIAMVGLAARADYYPRQLSGGQRMRVSIARALSLSPRILLLDEPFGALDEMTREHLNEELLAIRQQEAWTAFFVTHSVSEAVFLSNRVLVMGPGPGRIVRELAVDLPYPRTEATRESAAYQRLVGEVSGVLRTSHLTFP